MHSSTLSLFHSLLIFPDCALVGVGFHILYSNRLTTLVSLYSLEALADRIALNRFIFFPLLCKLAKLDSKGGSADIKSDQWDA